eukprot:8718306-Pyramimonas_sp.AAC.1
MRGPAAASGPRPAPAGPAPAEPAQPPGSSSCPQGAGGARGRPALPSRPQRHHQEWGPHARWAPGTGPPCQTQMRATL